MVRRTEKESGLHSDIYEGIAEEYGVLPQELRKEMQDTIDASWSSDDEQVIRNQRVLFPNGKPTVEEFITTMALVLSLDAEGDLSNPDTQEKR